MIKVLVAEDSPLVKTLMLKCLASDAELEVIGIASNGKEAITLTDRLKPDVITMDVNMPVMNGLDATRVIMEKNPTPIIILSSEYDPKDVSSTFNALEAGAVAIAEKPLSYGTEKYETVAAKLRQTIKLMAEIKVVRRTKPKILDFHQSKPLTFPATSADKKDYRILAIGASTGGPVVIEKILSSLKDTFTVPIVIVQHIVPAFSHGFVEWLGNLSKRRVKFAEDGEVLRPWHCYVAPPGKHLKIREEGIFSFSDEDPVNNSVPSVSVFFLSVAMQYKEKAIGILLTGMGKDGARELKEIKDAGGLTIAQSRESCIVYGMPAEAANHGAASFMLNPDEIINYLNLLQIKPFE